MSGDGLRARILEAAASVLRERGPTPRLLSAVSERAGVSRPTLYKYVGDQAAIYDALVRQEIQRIIDDVVPDAAAITDARVGYLDIVVALAERARTHPVLTVLLERHPALAMRHIGSVPGIVLEVAGDRLEPVVRRGIAEGRLPDVDIRSLLIWTSRIVLSLVLMPMPDDDGPEGVRASVDRLLTLGGSVKPEDTP